MSRVCIYVTTFLYEMGSGMADTSFTFDVDESLKNAFTKAAEDGDLTGADLLRGFMRHFVTQQKRGNVDGDWFAREVQIGIDAADAGDFLSAEEVEAEAAAWRAAIRSGVNGTTP
jgi:predicted transcriptional regulator